MKGSCPECGGTLPEVQPGHPLVDCAHCAALVTPAGGGILALVQGPLDETRVEGTVQLPQEFTERFLIGRVLGTGGMGTVYRAVEQPTGREVAVKVMTRMNDQESLARFRREGRLLSALTHPNVVRVVGIFQLDKLPCLVMEFIDGGTLRDKLVLERRLALPAAVSVMLDVLAGLEAFHAAGIVHRDLKPENILLTHSGQAKVADLGVAKSADQFATDLTATGALIGTPRYMAPEQVLGQPLSAGADLYSAGMVLYEMLSGRTAVAGGLVELINFHQSRKRPPILNQVVPEIPAPLARFVDEMLDPDSQNRARSAAEVARRLRAVVAPVDGVSLPEAPRSDEELMTATRNGEMPAFEELVRRHHRVAWRIAQSFLADSTEAEDVAQHAFMKILEAASSYRPSARFLTYLRRVVSRLCLDHAARKRPVYMEEIPTVKDPLPTPGEAAVRAERTSSVREALSCLPAMQRLACVLHYYDRLSHVQIGEVLAITPKAVERLLARARERMSLVLEP